MQGPPRGGHHDRARQLEPGHHHDRRGHRQRRIRRAAHRPGAGTRHRGRAPGRRAGDAGGPDGAQPRGRPRGRRGARPVRRPPAGHSAVGHSQRGGPRAVPQADGRHRRAVAAERHGRLGRGSGRRHPGDRPAHGRQAGLHPRRNGRRHRLHGGRAPADRGRGRRGEPHRADAAREGPARLEGDRVRGDARRRRQLHHGLQHGEHRPDGRPHRRQHRRRPQPDAVGQGVPDAPHRQPEDHTRAGHRGRMQRPARAGAGRRRGGDAATGKRGAYRRVRNGAYRRV